MTLRTISRQVDSSSISEFSFVIGESAPEFVADHLADWLTSYISDGAEFSDGQTLQFGYSLLKCEVKGRSLRLQSPDFQNMPIKWVDDLGNALLIFAYHEYVPETFGYISDAPALHDSALIGNQFNELPMFIDRMVPDESKPNDSGWFIGSGADDVDNDDPDQLQLMSLYEAMLYVPHVVRFLSLPVGCQVMFSDEQPVIFRNWEELQIPKGSYLDGLFNPDSLT
ncbi:MAG: hypothetical protein ACI8P0_004032 [Planctomycetaceae bacterium]